MNSIELQVQGLTEEEIRKGCIAGNRNCQEILYKTFSPRMFGICLRYANDYHSAEDILQEGFIKVFNHIDKYKGSGSFEGWLKRIFINTAIEQYRKAQNHSHHLEIEKVSLPNQTETTFENLKAQDLLKMVQQLSPGYRNVFNLYVIEGYPHKEIAKMLDISEGTSKSQLARARSILQKMIETLNQ